MGYVFTVKIEIIIKFFIAFVQDFAAFLWSLFKDLVDVLNVLGVYHISAK